MDQKRYDESNDKKTNYSDDSNYSQPAVKIKSEDGKGNHMVCDEKSSRCGPDFNELMDDSTNDLEMHMSDDANVRNDGDRDIKKEENNNKIDNCIKDVHAFSTPRHSLISNNVNSKSSVSAFRPVTNDTKDSILLSKSTMDISNAVSAAMSPLGPYPPVGATFVGYPDNAGLTSPEKDSSHSLATGKQTPNICLLQPKSRVKINDKIEDSLSTVSSNESRSAESPETMQKEYTILQPAGSKGNSASSRNISMDSSSSEASVTPTLPRPTKFESSPIDSPSSEQSSKHALESQRYGELSSGGLNKGNCT